MSLFARAAWVLWVVTMLGCQSAAPQAPRPAELVPIASPSATPADEFGLVPFASDEGLRRLARADAKRGFAALANQFEAQLNGAFCGPTTAAIVLNAARSRSPDLPRDRERLREGDLKNVPPGFDPIVPRYTQDNVIAKGAKTRAQVLGEPIVIDGKTKRDFGYQLRQFDEMLRANGLATRAVVVDEPLGEDAVRSELIAALNRPETYAVIN
ncbi:MAG: phytochelatin synthase family protein, partial [Solirubrobacteraceae bacterium]|nr:phytochelatin synthase family protein [Solirubrobacteraceae bacterium]